MANRTRFSITWELLPQNTAHELERDLKMEQHREKDFRSGESGLWKSLDHR